MEFLEEIRLQTRKAVEELIEVSGIGEEDILVVGCSSSEICGEKIGTVSNADVGEAVFEEIKRAADSKGIFIAAQCCEHLNRALIVEEECGVAYCLERVNAVPALKAGGSFATAAYKGMEEPWTVESLEQCAAAGMDIGDTLIGMHLKNVAVPVRLSVSNIGKAHLTCARTRAKYIGGERAGYDKDLG